MSSSRTSEAVVRHAEVARFYSLTNVLISLPSPVLGALVLRARVTSARKARSLWLPAADE
jgi:hypothetical protein